MNSPVTNSSPNAVFAEEVHASRAWGIVTVVLPCAVFAAMAAKAPLPALFLGIFIPLMFVGAAMPWSGFHYWFSPAGVEVRMLGFRLRSIPAAEIRSYAVDRWSALCGYGIRGIGKRKAYVWRNRGVRIETTEGEVFLGHHQPDKIVHDLDLITRNHEAPLPQGS